MSVRSTHTYSLIRANLSVGSVAVYFGEMHFFVILSQRNPRIQLHLNTLYHKPNFIMATSRTALRKAVVSPADEGIWSCRRKHFSHRKPVKQVALVIGVGCSTLVTSAVAYN